MNCHTDRHTERHLKYSVEGRKTVHLIRVRFLRQESRKFVAPNKRVLQIHLRTRRTTCIVGLECHLYQNHSNSENKLKYNWIWSEKERSRLTKIYVPERAKWGMHTNRLIIGHNVRSKPTPCSVHTHSSQVSCGISYRIDMHTQTSYAQRTCNNIEWTTQIHWLKHEQESLKFDSHKMIKNHRKSHRWLLKQSSFRDKQQSAT